MIQSLCSFHVQRPDGTIVSLAISVDVALDRTVTELLVTNRAVNKLRLGTTAGRTLDASEGQTTRLALAVRPNIDQDVIMVSGPKWDTDAYRFEARIN